MQSPVSIPAAVWHEQVPFSPNLDAFAPGLAMAIGPGQRKGTTTPVAAIRYRMPDNVVRRYRGRVDPAVMLVAVAEAGGAVYSAPCAGQDAPPATLDPAADPAPVRGQPSVGGAINVDLAAQLGLPPGAGRYRVFAWLDEWVSEVASVDLPADPARVDSPLRRPPNSPATVRVASASGSAALALAAAGPGAAKASWSSAAAAPVIVLGYDLEQRAVRWEVAADTKAPQAKAGSAEIDAGSFLGGSGPGAIAVLAGGQVKSVLVRR